MRRRLREGFGLTSSPAHRLHTHTQGDSPSDLGGASGALLTSVSQFAPRLAEFHRKWAGQSPHDHCDEKILEQTDMWPQESREHVNIEMTAPFPPGEWESRGWLEQFLQAEQGERMADRWTSCYLAWKHLHSYGLSAPHRKYFTILMWSCKELPAKVRGPQQSEAVGLAAVCLSWVTANRHVCLVRELRSQTVRDGREGRALKSLPEHPTKQLAPANDRGYWFLRRLEKSQAS